MQQQMTIEQLTDNPVRDFLRSKVKSGSLPTRANFYIHNAAGGASSDTGASAASTTATPSTPQTVEIGSLFGITA